MKTHALLLMILLTSLVLAEPNVPTKDPAIEIAELKTIIKRREKTIRLARKKIAELKKENRQLRTLCRRAGVRIPRFLEQLPQIDIAEMVGPFDKDLEVGQVGRLKGVRIIQVIDANNSLAEITITIPHWSSGIPSTGSSGGFRVYRPAFINIKASFYDPIYKKELIWLEGINTTATADNAYLKLNKVFVVAGTKTYTNTLNAKRTVYVLRIASTKDIENAHNNLIKGLN